MILLALSLAAASAEELYDPAPPPGSAFVRVINAGAEATPAVTLGPVPLGVLAPAAASAYVPLPASTDAVTTAGASWKPTLEAGGFYTLVTDGSVMKDAANGSLAKVLVQVYNLSDAADVDLRVSASTTGVVQDVAAGEVGTREVNALQIGFDLVADDTVVTTFDQVTLAQGGVYTFVVTGEGDARTAAMSRASTRTR